MKISLLAVAALAVPAAWAGPVPRVPKTAPAPARLAAPSRAAAAVAARRAAVVSPLPIAPAPRPRAVEMLKGLRRVNFAPDAIESAFENRGKPEAAAVVPVAEPGDLAGLILTAADIVGDPDGGAELAREMRQTHEMVLKASRGEPVDSSRKKKAAQILEEGVQAFTAPRLEQTVKGILDVGEMKGSVNSGNREASRVLLMQAAPKAVAVMQNWLSFLGGPASAGLKRFPAQLALALRLGELRGSDRGNRDAAAESFGKADAMLESLLSAAWPDESLLPQARSLLNDSVLALQGAGLEQFLADNLKESGLTGDARAAAEAELRALAGAAAAEAQGVSAALDARLKALLDGAKHDQLDLLLASQLVRRGLAYDGQGAEIVSRATAELSEIHALVRRAREGQALPAEAVRKAIHSVQEDAAMLGMAWPTLVQEFVRSGVRRGWLTKASAPGEADWLRTAGPRVGSIMAEWVRALRAAPTQS